MNTLLMLFMFVPILAFLLLGWVGQCPVEYPYTEIGVICMIYYFLFFLIIIPFLGKFESYLVRYNN